MDYFTEIYWDKGKREVNQDSISLQEIWLKGEKAVFLLVCDGIGGLWRGEVASGYVAEKMTEWFYKEAAEMLARGRSRRRMLQSGLRVLYACNEAFQNFREEKGVKLGTTVTAVLLYRGCYYLWHTGDTRAYRILAGGRKIKKLTTDHTGEHHVLLRCVGSFEWQQPDVSWGRLGKKEVLLVCSDGFWNKTVEEKLKEALGSRCMAGRESMMLTLKELGEYVKRHGERDNISAAGIKRV